MSMPIISLGYTDQYEDVLLFSDMTKMSWTAQNFYAQAAFLSPVSLLPEESNLSEEMLYNHRWEISVPIPEKSSFYTSLEMVQ